MQRRGFLAVMSSGAAVLGLPIFSRAAPGEARSIKCHVAGVRFHSVDAGALHTSEPVKVVRDRYLGQVCYKVQDSNARTIGNVPRIVLPLLNEREVDRAWLSNVIPHAVPWKQFEVTLILR
jgi:hypothetical protein